MLVPDLEAEIESPMYFLSLGRAPTLPVNSKKGMICKPTSLHSPPFGVDPKTEARTKELYPHADILAKRPGIKTWR